jgi:hypothetical protein
VGGVALVLTGLQGDQEPSFSTVRGSGWPRLKQPNLATLGHPLRQMVPNRLFHAHSVILSVFSI